MITRSVASARPRWSVRGAGLLGLAIGTALLVWPGLARPHGASTPPGVAAPWLYSNAGAQDSGGAADACAIRELRRSDIQGLKVYSPDGTRFLINKEDEKGVAQIYVGMADLPLTCITCAQQSGGPDPRRFKMQPKWHPSGRWISLAVERDQYSPPPVLGWSRRYVEGQLQNGLWTNMYAVSPDGLQWHRLTDFRSGARGVPDGFTGPAFTPDGRRAVWSQIADGNVLRYRPFGRWELILADFEDAGGTPRFSNARDITPRGMHWNEPGNFAPDNMSLLLSGSVESDAQGMDQYVLNVLTGALVNLTRSPEVWDEHGRFSPDGQKIVFMSAHPYREDRNASKILTIKTEFMLMHADGSGLTQLTHFRQPGYPEYETSGIAANPQWSPDGRSVNLARLFFPDYQFWDVVFDGPCGNRTARR